MHGEEEGMLRREMKTTMSVKKMQQEHLSSIAKKGGCELQPTAEIGGWDHVELWAVSSEISSIQMRRDSCECLDELGAVSSGISSIQMRQDGVEHRSWNLLDMTWRSSSVRRRAYRSLKRWKKPWRAFEPLQIPSAMTWMLQSSQGWVRREAGSLRKEEVGLHHEGRSWHRLKKFSKKNSKKFQKVDRN